MNNHQLPTLSLTHCAESGTFALIETLEKTMAKPRRTKADYLRLFDDPTTLFSPHGENRGANVTLFPNGAKEIWITGADGKGFRITASEGRAGLALHISTIVGSPPVTLSANREGDYEVIRGLPDLRQIDLTQYNSDANSQAFKLRYQSGDLNATKVLVLMHKADEVAYMFERENGSFAFSYTRERATPMDPEPAAALITSLERQQDNPEIRYSFIPVAA